MSGAASDLEDLSKNWKEVRLEKHSVDGWRLLLKRDYTIYGWKGTDIDEIIHRAWMEEPPDLTGDIEGGLW